MPHTPPPPVAPPGGLTEAQAAEFRRLAGMLQRRIRGFHESDAAGLARLIQLRDAWQRLLSDITTNGETFTANGTERPRPQCRLMMQLAGEIAKLERQYGLTPATRSRERNHIDHLLEGAGNE